MAVALFTCEIVVLALMFVPVINMPGIKPVVLAHVTLVLPFVVQLLSTIGTV